MSQHNVVAASELVGLSEKTIYKHIKDGSLSATKSADGKFSLETTELLRRYGAFKPIESTEESKSPSLETNNSIELRIEVASLRSENTGLKSLLEEKDRRIELLEFRKDKTPVEAEYNYNLRTIIAAALISAALLLCLLVLKFFFFFNG